mgnify:CR=1 FL=1
MKKLGILVMVLVLVWGISVGVMAELASEIIPINASVAEKATIDVDDVNNQIDLDIDNLLETESSGGHTVSHNNADLIIRSNTDIKVTFQENLSRVLANILGNEDLVWAFNYYQQPQGVTGDDWVVSPNVTISEWTWGTDPMTMYPHSDGMAKDVYLAQGYNELEVGMETKWRQKDKEENMLAWYDLLADESISANVTVTVAAQ